MHLLFSFFLQNGVEARLFQTKVPVAIYFDLVYLNIVVLIKPVFRNKNQRLRQHKITCTTTQFDCTRCKSTIENQYIFKLIN